MTSIATPQAATPSATPSLHRVVLPLAGRVNLGLLATCAFGAGMRLSVLVSAPRATVEGLP